MKLFTKILALMCSLMIVFSLVACGGSSNDNSDDASTTAADSADPIVGSWEYESGGYTYNFNADGTGTYDIGSGVMNFTYEATDTTLSILYEGNTSPMELEYKIDGTKLNVIDSFGSDTIYIRK